MADQEQKYIKAVKIGTEGPYLNESTADRPDPFERLALFILAKDVEEKSDMEYDLIKNKLKSYDEVPCFKRVFFDLWNTLDDINEEEAIEKYCTFSALEEWIKTHITRMFREKGEAGAKRAIQKLENIYGEIIDYSFDNGNITLSVNIQNVINNAQPTGHDEDLEVG